MKHYYAQYDITVTESNPGHGFCNSKKAITFSSKEKRDRFLKSRKHFDFRAKAITRKDAAKRIYLVDPNTGDKGLALDGTDEFENCLVLKPGN